MMIRVNLLKENEFRYQGAVSRGFIVQISLITVGCMFILYLLATFIQYRSLQQSLAWSQERWNRIKPAYENVQAMKVEIGHNRLLLDELKGWQRSRVEWHEPLRELPRIAPAATQFTRLNIWGAVENPKPAAATSKKAALDKPKTPEQTPAPTRKYLINFEGRADDKLADKVVLQFVDDLRQTTAFKPILESVKLQGLRLESGRETTARIFNIEAATYSKEIK